MEMILAITGHKKEDVAFVGDRIYTDVASGVNNGGRVSGADWRDKNGGCREFA